MDNLSIYAKTPQGISRIEVEEALKTLLSSFAKPLKKVLLLPPDYTRFHSYAGQLSNMLYHMLSPACEVDIMPALGTHVPVTQSEWQGMFGDIPYEVMLVHHWRNDVVRLGEVPGEFVREISEGLLSEPVPVEINRRLLDTSYDLILSIGQVVPHEVVGMANHTKNLLVGCGGAGMINASHMLGAVYGMERIMGRDKTPVRAVFDYAAQHFLSHLPLCYLLTVTTAPGGNIRLHGLFSGNDRRCFEEAVALAQQKNLSLMEKPIQKAVVYLDPQEFKSTWLGNKAIYRTRMAIADGGQLIILAPGVSKFGEDEAVDALIRKYGYTGRENILRQSQSQQDLKQNLSAAAHLIHGSSDGRFSITYCTQYLKREEVEGVGYNYLPLDEALAAYPPDKLSDGFKILPNGEEIFYISNPALGLWADRKKFEQQ